MNWVYIFDDFRWFCIGVYICLYGFIVYEFGVLIFWKLLDEQMVHTGFKRCNPWESQPRCVSCPRSQPRSTAQAWGEMDAGKMTDLGPPKSIEVGFEW